MEIFYAVVCVLALAALAVMMIASIVIAGTLVQIRKDGLIIFTVIDPGQGEEWPHEIGDMGAHTPR